MSQQRDFLARHLREMLAAVENPESDLSWVNSWWWDRPYEREIRDRLRGIEELLSDSSKQRCALADGDRAGVVVELITGIEGKRNQERKHVSVWLSGTEELTIVDPYIFSFTGPNKVYRTQAAYVAAVNDLLPKGLRKLDVFHLPGPNRKILGSIREYCQLKNIILRSWETTEVHDRVLIKSEFEAKLLGTSFGGLGNKIAFIVDLPVEDLKTFRHELFRIKQEV